MEIDEDAQMMDVDFPSMISKGKGKAKDDQPIDNDNLPWYVPQCLSSVSY